MTLGEPDQNDIGGVRLKAGGLCRRLGRKRQLCQSAGQRQKRDSVRHPGKAHRRAVRLPAQWVLTGEGEKAPGPPFPRQKRSCSKGLQNAPGRNLGPFRFCRIAGKRKKAFSPTESLSLSGAAWPRFFCASARPCSQTSKSPGPQAREGTVYFSPRPRCPPSFGFSFTPR